MQLNNLDDVKKFLEKNVSNWVIRRGTNTHITQKTNLVIHLQNFGEVFMNFPLQIIIVYIYGRKKIILSVLVL